MGPNYNIHGTADDEYYYCSNNDCPCNGSSDHRGNDNYGTGNNDYNFDDDISASNYHNYCCGHCGYFYNAYDEPICDNCGAPADFSSSYNFFKSLFPDTTDDLAEHYDNIFGTYDNDPEYYNGAYRTAYNDYKSTRGDIN
jgi:hypothetical protein